MKKVVLLFILSLILFANHVNWLGNYDKALKIAKKEHKPILVLLVKNSCKECKDIIRKYFSNKSYIDKINKDYICVILNYDIGNYPNELIYSNTFPALFILNSKNEIFLTKPIYNKDIKEFLKNKFY